ncbi:MAG: T9SS type A sorting domain-containing protein [Fluviicola sp.]|nr:T9SS type A sorting domain-containing protein [Fluviicola sp.]
MMKTLLSKTITSLGLSFVAMMFSFAFGQVSVQNASGPAMCDGSAYLLDSTAVLNSISWQGNGSVIGTATYYVGNLCPGTYTVTYDAPNTMTFTFTVSGVNCNGLTATVTTTDALDSLSCDGTASVTVTGGTAPYSYNWSNAVTTAVQYNLCGGSYTCVVTDMNGCTSSDVASVGVINGGGLPNDSTLVFVNNNYPGVPAVAFYTELIEDCSLDYNSVAGASITAVNYSSLGSFQGLDTVLVTWTLVDSSNNVIQTYNVTYMVSDSLNGVIDFSLIVMCGQKSLDYNTIQMSDRWMYEPLGLEETTSAIASVVNPMNENLVVRLQESASGSLTLVDGFGKVVRTLEFNQQSVLTVPVANLAQGTYFLQVNVAGKTSNLKVVK